MPAREVRSAADPLGLPPPPVIDMPIDASPNLAHYQIVGDLVGHWYRGEVVEADEIGPTAERARLLAIGVIAPVTGAGATPISRAEAFARTGPMAPIKPAEQVIAETVASAVKAALGG